MFSFLFGLVTFIIIALCCYLIYIVLARQGT